MPRTKNETENLTNTIPALDHKLGPIEYRSIDAIKSYGRELRKHPDTLIVKLMAAIREFGFSLPLLVDEAGTLIVGEARLKAAKRLGMTEIPVITASHWSPAQVRAYRLADNKLGELSSWNRDELTIELSELLEFEEVQIEMLGWEAAEIDLMFEHNDVDGKASEDPADSQIEAPDAPTSQLGDLWLLDKHRLACANALEPEAWKILMEGRTGVMAFVDPPYNVPVSGHVCGLGKVQHAEFAMASGEMSRDQFTAFNIEWQAVMLSHLRDGALAFICMDWRHIGELTTAIDANGLSLINLCVWNKSNGGMGSLYRSKHELVFVAKKGNAPHINNVELGKHGRYRTNVWDYAGVNTFSATRMNDLADHPTIKPVALVADAIRDASKPGDIVLDAFLGSGTTMLAAERTRRVTCGIEIEPGYVDVAIERWERMTGGEAVLSATGQTYAEVAAERAQPSDETDPAA